MGAIIVPPQQQQHQQQQHRSEVVIKLLTFPANRSDTKKFINGRIGTYKSVTNETEQRHEALYTRLLWGRNDTESSQVLQHFAIPIGSMDVPLSLVRRAAQSANQSLSVHSPYRGMIYPVSGYDHRDRGQIFLPLPPDARSLRQVLDSNKNNNKDILQQRQTIVHDLIRMYQYMFERHVLVCDIKMDHFLYSPTTDTVTSIDYDSIRFTSTSNEQDESENQSTVRLHTQTHTHTHQWQQWQLLVLIAHVCDDGTALTKGSQFGRIRQRLTRTSIIIPGLVSPSGLASIVCGARGGDTTIWQRARSIFAKSLERCQFQREESHENTTTITTSQGVRWDIFENETLSNDNIQEIYDSLLRSTIGEHRTTSQ